MNSNCLLAFTEVMTHDRVIILYCNDSLLIPLVLRQVPLAVALYLTEFYLFQAWTWQLTMLQIYVTLWGRWFVCVSVSQLITLATF